MANAATSWLTWFVTYTAVVVEFTATAEVPRPPVANGDPFTAPKAPEAASITYAETLFDAVLAAYKNAPCGSIPSPIGCAPAGKGEPLIGESVPLLWTANPSTTLCAVSATYRKLPLRPATTAFGVAPTPMANGDPATAVNTPLFAMANTATVASPGLATKRKSPLGEMASDCGCDTGVIGKGEPATAPRLPLPGSMVNAVMLPDVWLATYRNDAVGDTAIEIGPVPVLKIFGGFTGTTMLLLTGTETLPLC